MVLVGEEVNAGLVVVSVWCQPGRRLLKLRTGAWFLRARVLTG